MSDLTQEAEKGRPEDATGVDPRSMAETTAVPNAYATELAELAWSNEDAWADIPTSQDPKYPQKRSLPQWITAVTAVLAAGAAAVWLGAVLYREEQPARPPVAVTTPTPTISLTPTALPPPAPLPPETPHPAPKYPWVAIAISQQIRPNGGRSISSGYGFTQEMAIQSALISCRSAGNDDCSADNSIVDGCIAIAVGAHGEYGAAAGPTRDDAISTARANAPWATGAQPFCSWDGNGVPTTTLPPG